MAWSSLLLLSCFLLFSCVLGDFVRGTGGRPFSSECIIELPNGATVHEDHAVLEDGTVQPLPNLCSGNSTDNKKREADGWNEYVYYYPAATSIDQFNGDWVVPGYPGLGYRGETVFLFTGLEPAAEDAIIQPVLQYGYSAAIGSGGPAWYIAIWYVYNNNQNAATTQVVQVYPGQTLHTTMVRYPGSYWNINMYVDGNLASAINFPDRDYNIAFNTLEIYGVRDCGSLPYQTTTNFFNLQVHQLGGGFLAPQWTGVVTQTDCGQSVGCSGTTCGLTYGVPALLSPAVFDAGTYLAINPDLQGNDLQSHWITYGFPPIS